MSLSVKECMICYEEPMELEDAKTRLELIKNVQLQGEEIIGAIEDIISSLVNPRILNFDGESYI